MNAPLLWPAAAPDGALAESEVHVWGWSLLSPAGDRSPANLSPAIEILSDAERQRMHAFHFADDRARYGLTHVTMRLVLAAYLRVQPEEICFAANRFGKPELAVDASALHFSLSHSQRVAVVAVTRSGPIGVDVEDVRPIERAVAAAYFSRAELMALDRLSGDDWLEAFYRCWTRKEAILKAEGVGLQRGLDRFNVSLLPGVPAALLGSRERFAFPWALHDVPPAPGTAGAVATAHADLRIACFRFEA